MRTPPPAALAASPAAPDPATKAPQVRPRAILGVALLLLLLPAAAQAGRTVRVGVHDFAPIIFIKDGGGGGLFVDLLREVAARQDWDLSFRPGSLAECLERMENGEIDLLPAIAATAERRKRYDFTQDHMFMDWAVVYRRKDSGVNAVLDLAGKTIAALRGSVYTEEIQNLLQQFDIEADILLLDDYAAVLDAVNQGKADAGICTNILGARLEDRRGVERTGIVFAPIKLRYAVKTGENADLLAALDHSFAAFKEDRGSAYYSLYDTWIGLQENSAATAWLWWGLGGLSGALLLLLGLVLLLRSLVASRTAELTRSNAALQESEERHRRMVDTANEGVWSMDAEHRTTYVNEVQARMLGYSPGEMLGRRVEEFLFPEDLAHHRREMRGRREGRSSRYERRFRSKDGGEVWTIVSATALKDAAGAFAGSFAMFTDITERKRAEEALRKSEERLALALEAASDGLWDWRVPSGAAYFSPRYYTMLGYEPGEFEGSHAAWRRLLHPDDLEGVERAVAVGLARAVPYEIEFRMRAKSGEWRWILARGQVVEQDEAGRAVRMVGTHVDITERKRAAEALREREETLRGIFDTVHSGVILVDEQGVVVFANARMASLFGCGLDRIVGSPYLDLIHEGQSEEIWAAMQALMTGRIPAVDLERLYLRKDGTTFWGHLAGTRLRRPDGSFWALVGVITDITERRRTKEEALSMALFPAEDPNPVLRISRDGALMYANKAGRELLSQWGTGPGQALSGERAALFTGALASGKPRDAEFVLDGRTYLTALAPFPDRGYVNAYVVDITGRKQAEDALKASEERYRLLFEKITDPILVADAQTGVLVECNSAAAEFFGRPREELIGLHQSALEPAKAPIGQCTPEFLRILDNPNLLLEMEMLAAGGRLCPMSVRAGVFKVQGRRLILGMFRDISATKEAEDHLRLAKEAAEAASRSKSEFLATMSHEIRTPLNGVLGMLQLALASGLPPELREYVSTAMQSGRSLLRVLSDILDISRIEAGALHISDEDFPLDDVFDPIVQAFGDQARAKGLDFSCAVDPGLPRALRGDAGRIRQVAYNLVGNALKYTDRGEVRLEVYGLPGEGDPGRVRLHLSVSDTGIGVPENKLRSVFEVFSQADGSYTRRYGGAGLGLSIVKRLVGLMGGAIQFCSQAGEGTDVHVCLPLEPARSAPRPAPSLAAAPGPAAAARAMDVLLAEDDSVSSLTVSHMLTRAGHRVHAVRNGAEALRLLAAQAADCVLMDIQMPEMDGVEATRRIRSGEAGEAARRIPIIALTAHAMKGDREEFLAAGMDGYLAKPVDMDELVRMLAGISGQG